MRRVEFSKIIKSNIDNYGHHVSIISGGPEPRYANTIGLTQKYGVELILAGGIQYSKDDGVKIIRGIVEQVNDFDNVETELYTVNPLGSFKLQKVHASWSKITMIGVLDYYDACEVEAYQILPDKVHWTLDIPDMSNIWAGQEEAVWKWLIEDWEYDVPSNVNVVTNISALKGGAVTEVMRWEPEAWEMYAGPGPDVVKEEVRIVPIGLMFGLDSTLEAALNLKVGKGIWRKGKSDVWHDWG